MYRDMGEFAPHGNGLAIAAPDLVVGFAGDHGVRVGGAPQCGGLSFCLDIEVRRLFVSAVLRQQGDSAGPGLQGDIVYPDGVFQGRVDFRPCIAPAAQGGSVRLGLGFDP